MSRIVLAALLAAFLLLSAGGGALAQDSAPAPVEKSYGTKPADFQHGDGFYLSSLKIILLWVVFFCWVWSLNWANQDAVRLTLDYNTWNPILFFPFFVGFILALAIPLFVIGLPLLLLAYVIPFVLYVQHRNSKVLFDNEKVFTRDHLSYWWAKKLSIFGVKVDVKEKDWREEGPPVKLTPKGAPTELENKANLLLVRQSSGFVSAKQILADALLKRAESVMLDFTQQAVGVRYLLDGVWHQAESRDRENGDLALAVMKKLANLNMNDRRSRQEGVFGVEFQGKAMTCKLSSQGTETGERVLLAMEVKVVQLKTLDELGMRPKMQEQVKEPLSQKQGLFVFSALPANGLSTSIDVTLKAVDRFMRDFVAVEDIRKRDHEVENVPVTTYDSAAGETPMTVLPNLIRSYPNAIVVRDPVNVETLSLLCEQVGEGRLIVTSVKAKECAEALLRLLMLKIPAAQLAPVLTGVLNQRLVRKLCEQCKEAYAPSPEIIKQLGLPEGRITALFRERQPFQPKEPNEQPPPPCEACLAIGYKGRTAIFEFLPVNDEVRQALVQSPKLEVLRNAARRAGMRTMQEEGILLVAKGVTSLPELMRVMKQ